MAINLRHLNSATNLVVVYFVELEEEFFCVCVRFQEFSFKPRYAYCQCGELNKHLRLCCYNILSAKFYIVLAKC